MVRIRGSIGDWPVDLTLELDAEDWRQLAQHVPPPPLGEPQVAAARAPAPAAPVDRLWQTAQDLLRGSGRIEGPQLLAELAVQQLARQQYEAALDGLLKLFLRNRGYQDDLPRKTLVQVFDLLGNDHPLVTAYRRKLYQALY